MIRCNATIFRRYGEYRYSGYDVVLTCDESGCAATITATGLEHNGAAIEAIYLPRDCGWYMGATGEYCADHAGKVRTAEEDDE